MNAPWAIVLIVLVCFGTCIANSHGPSNTTLPLFPSTPTPISILSTPLVPRIPSPPVRPPLVANSRYLITGTGATGSFLVMSCRSVTDTIQRVVTVTYGGPTCSSSLTATMIAKVGTYILGGTSARIPTSGPIGPGSLGLTADPCPGLAKTLVVTAECWANTSPTPTFIVPTFVLPPLRSGQAIIQATAKPGTIMQLTCPSSTWAMTRIIGADYGDGFSCAYRDRAYLARFIGAQVLFKSSSAFPNTGRVIGGGTLGIIDPCPQSYSRRLLVIALCESGKSPTPTPTRTPSKATRLPTRTPTRTISRTRSRTYTPTASRTRTSTLTRTPTRLPTAAYVECGSYITQNSQQLEYTGFANIQYDGTIVLTPAVGLTQGMAYKEVNSLKYFVISFEAYIEEPGGGIALSYPGNLAMCPTRTTPTNDPCWDLEDGNPIGLILSIDTWLDGDINEGPAPSITLKYKNMDLAIARADPVPYKTWFPVVLTVYKIGDKSLASVFYNHQLLFSDIVIPNYVYLTPTRPELVTWGARSLPFTGLFTVHLIRSVSILKLCPGQIQCDRKAEQSVAIVGCPADSIINSISATYGDVSGLCTDPNIACSADVTASVSGQCLGRKQCVVLVSAQSLLKGARDPCPGLLKSLLLSITCSSGAGSLRLPAAASLAVSPPLSFGGEMTFEFWLELNTVPAANTRLFSFGNSGHDTIFLAWDSNRALKLTTFRGVASLVPDTRGVTVPLSTWTHVAVAVESTRTTINGFPGGRATMYVNGAAMAAYPVYLPASAVRPQQTIGGQNQDFTIDEFRLWSEARSASEISSYRQYKLRQTYSTLLLNYGFDVPKPIQVDSSGQNYFAVPGGTSSSSSSWQSDECPTLSRSFAPCGDYVTTSALQFVPHGNAHFTGNGDELRLTTAVAGQRSWALMEVSRISQFVATFNVYVGSCGSSPAKGLSFGYGRIPTNSAIVYPDPANTLWQGMVFGPTLVVNLKAGEYPSRFPANSIGVFSGTYNRLDQYYPLGVVPFTSSLCTNSYVPVVMTIMPLRNTNQTLISVTYNNRIVVNRLRLVAYKHTDAAPHLFWVGAETGASAQSVAAMSIRDFVVREICPNYNLQLY